MVREMLYRKRPSHWGKNVQPGNATMDITVKCPCSSNYTFQEEPVSGRLRFPVACPNCGVDGTNLANEYIQKVQSGELEREQERERKRTSVWWRQIFRRGGQKAEPSADSAPTTIRLGLGVVGACIGGFVGLTVWYLIKRWTGFELGIVAWGIGLLAGMGARMAVPSGSFALAGVASLSTALAIMGGQYFVLRDTVDRHIKFAVAAAYEEMVDYAKGAEKASTDGEIRKLLDQHGFSPRDLAPGENAVLCKKRELSRFGIFFGTVMKEGSVPRLKEIVEDARDRDDLTEEDITEFRHREAPELKAYLKGKPSREEFSQALNGMVRPGISLNGMIGQSWSPYMLLWLVLGIVTAYRLAYSRSETDV